MTSSRTPSFCKLVATVRRRSWNTPRFDRHGLLAAQFPNCLVKLKLCLVEARDGNTAVRCREHKSGSLDPRQRTKDLKEPRRRAECACSRRFLLREAGNVQPSSVRVDLAPFHLGDLVTTSAGKVQGCLTSGPKGHPIASAALHTSLSSIIASQDALARPAALRGRRFDPGERVGRSDPALDRPATHDIELGVHAVCGDRRAATQRSSLRRSANLRLRNRRQAAPLRSLDDVALQETFSLFPIARCSLRVPLDECLYDLLDKICLRRALGLGGGSSRPSFSPAGSSPLADRSRAFLQPPCGPP